MCEDATWVRGHLAGEPGQLREGARCRGQVGKPWRIRRASLTQWELGCSEGGRGEGYTGQLGRARNTMWEGRSSLGGHWEARAAPSAGQGMTSRPRAVVGTAAQAGQTPEPEWGSGGDWAVVLPLVPHPLLLSQSVLRASFARPGVRSPMKLLPGGLASSLWLQCWLRGAGQNPSWVKRVLLQARWGTWMPGRAQRAAMDRRQVGGPPVQSWGNKDAPS